MFEKTVKVGPRGFLAEYTPSKPAFYGGGDRLLFEKTVEAMPRVFLIKNYFLV